MKMMNNNPYSIRKKYKCNWCGKEWNKEDIGVDKVCPSCNSHVGDEKYNELNRRRKKRNNS